MSKQIKVATEFSDFLINRDTHQGDGCDTGIEFRKKFLSEADNEDWWKKNNDKIVFDFSEVDTVGPSWANEVFAYFTKFGISDKELFQRFIFENITDVKLALIRKEVISGYKG